MANARLAWQVLNLISLFKVKVTFRMLHFTPMEPDGVEDNCDWAPREDDDRQVCFQDFVLPDGLNIEALLPRTLTNITLRTPEQRQGSCFYGFSNLGTPHCFQASFLSLKIQLRKLCRRHVAVLLCQPPSPSLFASSPSILQWWLPW